MAELLPSERLQPCLLDRLTDDEPTKTRESRDQRVLSVRRLRAGVLRDLKWLLNTGQLDGVEDLEPYPEVARSVLNYGLPDLTGKTASGVEASDLERMVRQAILDFEPRILPKTLRVRAILTKDLMNHNAISFDIEGELWSQPTPERLYLKTEIDLESGAVSVRDESGSGYR